MKGEEIRKWMVLDFFYGFIAVGGIILSTIAYLAGNPVLGRFIILGLILSCGAIGLIIYLARRREGN